MTIHVSDSLNINIIVTRIQYFFAGVSDVINFAISVVGATVGYVPPAPTCSGIPNTYVIMDSKESPYVQLCYVLDFGPPVVRLGEVIGTRSVVLN